MKDTLLLGLFRLLYSDLFRPLVAEKVNDTESKIDDALLNFLDKILGE